MANKKINKRKPVKASAKKEDKNSKFPVIMALIVVVTMVMSGIVYLFQTGLQGNSTPAAGENAVSVELFSVSPAGNESIVSEVLEVRAELVAQVNTPIYGGLIAEIENISVPGILNSTFEMGNGVQKYGGLLDGTYMLFKFRFDEVDENRTAQLRSELDSQIGGENYELLRACTGRLPGLADGLYFPCGLETRKGEYFKVLLLEKKVEGASAGYIGFVSSKVAVGRIVSAEAVNVTNLLAEGVLESEFDAEVLAGLPPEDMQIQPASFSVNGTLANQTIESLKALPGVSVSSAEDAAVVYYNSSKEELEGILVSEGLPYTEDAGYVFFALPLDSEVSQINASLEALGATNISFARGGFVSLPAEVLIDGMLASINGNDYFPARLGLETETGDQIEVELSVIQFGEQAFVIGATEA